jgi:hypothetical protein
MSALSEFGRHVGFCIDFLERSGAEGARACASRLLEARAIGSDDLTTAARRVLAIADDSPSFASLTFTTRSEAEEFRALSDPMLELARSIAGPPAGEERSPT